MAYLVMENELFTKGESKLYWDFKNRTWLVLELGSGCIKQFTVEPGQAYPLRFY